MKKENIKYPFFSECDFVRLYCSLVCKNGENLIINQHKLEKILCDFYLMPEFKNIFKDIVLKKDSINNKNSYLDLDIGFQEALAFGLLTKYDDNGEMQYIISCDDDIAQKIIINYENNIINEMTSLINDIFNKLAKNQKFNVYAIPFNKAFIVSKNKIEKFENIKSNSSINNDIDKLKIDNKCKKLIIKNKINKK